MNCFKLYKFLTNSNVYSNNILHYRRTQLSQMLVMQSVLLYTCLFSCDNLIQYKINNNAAKSIPATYTRITISSFMDFTHCVCFPTQYLPSVSDGVYCCQYRPCIPDQYCVYSSSSLYLAQVPGRLQLQLEVCHLRPEVRTLPRAECIVYCVTVSLHSVQCYP